MKKNNLILITLLVSIVSVAQTFEWKSKSAMVTNTKYVSNDPARSYATLKWLNRYTKSNKQGSKTRPMLL
jgi:uncharacterized membrane protein